MVSKWPTITVGQLAESISDTHKFGKDDLIFLNTSDILFGKILHYNYSPVRDWPGQAKKSIRRNDILFSEIRPSNGRWAYVDVDAEDFVVSTKLMVIRARPGRIAPRFLYHFLTSGKTTRWLQHLAESRSGTFPQITFDQVSELELVLPPMADQAAIVNFLDGIEDKIAVNQQMNKTLEAMGRALFKSWFVDFDPVRAKGEGRDPGLPKPIAGLVPDSFEATELGNAPKGWQIRSLGDVCLRVSMGPFGSDIKTDNFVPRGVPIVRGGNLRGGFVDDGFVYLSEEKATELKNANAFPGDIVITHRGTLGQVGLIPRKSRFPRYVVSQSQMVLSVDPVQASPEFVFSLLCSQNGQHQLLANTSQTGVPAIARPTSSVKAIRIVLPPKALLGYFDEVAGKMSERCNAGWGESRTLIALRDALLPKLISGELRLPDAERIAGGRV